MATTVSTNLVTNLTTSPDVTQTYFSRDMLERAEIYNWFDRWAEKKDLPPNEGKNIIFRRYLHLAAAISALTEGIPPAGKTPTLNDFTTVLAQYGDFIALSDFARFTARDPILNEWNKLLGEQAGYTRDMVKRNTADAGTNVVYSNGSARTDLNTPLDANDLDRAIRTMIRNGGVMVIPSMPGSTENYSSMAMPGYPAVIHPDTLFTLQNLGSGPSGYLFPNQYTKKDTEECGRYRNLAFFLAPDPTSLGAGARIRTGAGASSTVVANTSGTADVYETMIFSKYGFVSVNLNGQSLKTYMKPVGSAGALDPLEQVGTMGWKLTTAQLRTNENWIVRIEHCVEL